MAPFPNYYLLEQKSECGYKPLRPDHHIEALDSRRLFDCDRVYRRMPPSFLSL